MLIKTYVRSILSIILLSTIGPVYSASADETSVPTPLTTEAETADLFISACSENTELIATDIKSDELAERASSEWLYLGQEPPGLTPIAFAPGLVSTDHWEGSGVFTPDMKEFYLRRMGGDYETMVSTVFKYEDGEWQETVITPRMGQPSFSPNGKTMHLGRRYKERTESGWSETKSLGGDYENIRIMRLTTSSQGTYFFDEVGNNGDGKLRYSRVVDCIREDPKLLAEEINTGSWLAHPFIAPDESYIIWDGRRDGGFGSSDIYISFRQQDGTWGEAVNLGDEINTEAWEAGATVTPDGKYLFFNRNIGSGNYENVDIFWVDAQIIETLRDEHS